MSDNQQGNRPRAMGQFSASRDQAIDTSTTIVGGQPPRRKHVTVNVPVGVERALFLAAGDAQFCEALLRDRDQAVRARGLELRDSEALLLRAAPEAQLRAFVESLDVTPANVERRAFLGAVAASAAAVAAGGALSGCSDDDNGGGDKQSDGGPTDVKVKPEGYAADMGIRDTLPVDVKSAADKGGILPDTVPQDIPVSYPDMGVQPDTVPQDIPVSYPDAGVPYDLPPPNKGISPG